MAGRAAQSERADDNMPLPRDQAYYKKAVEEFAEKNWDSSLSAFEKAIGLCPCVRRLPVPSIFRARRKRLRECICKSFPTFGGRLPIQTDFYTIATRPCSCDSGVTQCDSPIHLKALEGCAAICEVRRDYDEALYYSKVMIIIAPNQPEGYLRMGKMMRIFPRGMLLKECRVVYIQGIRSVSKFGDRNHPKLRILSRLVMEVSRRNMLEKLPTEVIAMILGQLSLRDLCRAMRVCWGWKHQTLNQNLWKHLDFKTCKGVSMKALADVLSKRGKSATQSIKIRDAKRFELDGQKLYKMLYHLPNLRKFQVEAPHTFLLRKSNYSSWPDRVSTLTTLCLDYIFEDIGELVSILRYLAPNLKELALRGAPPFLWRIFPEMRTLETLQLQNRNPPDALKGGLFPSEIPSTFLRNLAYATQDLRRLNISGYNMRQPGDALTRIVDENNWQKLEEVSLSILRSARNDFTFDFRLTKNLKLLDLSDVGLLTSQISNMVNEGVDMTSHQQFENLEYFSCTSVVPASVLQQLLGPSVEKRKLRGFDLKYMTTVWDTEDIIGLSSFDFLHKEDIEALGLSNFVFPYPDRPAASGRASADAQSFLDWVSSFPNLHTVFAYPFELDGARFAIEGLVKLGIKTIYTDCLIGVERDRIMKLAKDKGVTIIHAVRDDSPRFWKSIQSQW